MIEGRFDLPFALPSTQPGLLAPEWDGRSFCIEAERRRVLRYLPEQDSGWSDALTTIHEQDAGDDHFIDRASRNHALGELARHLTGAAPVILEVGCSSGFMLREIRKAFPGACVLGADFVAGPLEALGSALPGVPLLQFDLRASPLPDESQDAIVLLNVLEHIDRDGDALGEVARMLKPGGAAVIEVPAGPGLFDLYDAELMHQRRYSLGQLVGLAEAVGLSVVSRSHLGFFIYPAFWLVKHKNRLFSPSSTQERARAVRAHIRRTRKQPLLTALMRAELALGRWVSYPFGIRCLLTCTKRRG
jgi:SAM-dependent methyltransferase